MTGQLARPGMPEGGSSPHPNPLQTNPQSCPSLSSRPTDPGRSPPLKCPPGPSNPAGPQLCVRHITPKRKSLVQRPAHRSQTAHDRWVSVWTEFTAFSLKPAPLCEISVSVRGIIKSHERWPRSTLDVPFLPPISAWIQWTSCRGFISKTPLMSVPPSQPRTTTWRSALIIRTWTSMRAVSQPPSPWSGQLGLTAPGTSSPDSVWLSTGWESSLRQAQKDGGSCSSKDPGVGGGVINLTAEETGVQGPKL